MKAEVKQKKNLIRNTSNNQKNNLDLTNIKKNELKEKEEKKQIIQYYPIGTKSDGKAIYLATNDTIQFTVNNNNCINYIPRKIKKSNTLKKEIFPQRCVEISFYKKEKKKSPENEIINFIYNPNLDKKQRPRNIIKIDKMKNSALYKFLKNSHENYIHKNNMSGEAIPKKIRIIKNSRNQNKEPNKKIIQLNDNNINSNENSKIKISKSKKQHNSLDTLFSIFYDQNIEKKPLQRRATSPNLTNRSADFMETPITTFHNNCLRNGIKMLDNAKFINSMKSIARKNGLLNAIKKFKRYKSLGKLNTLDEINNNNNLSNKNKNAFHIKDKTPKNIKKNYKINKIEEENETESPNILNNKIDSNDAFFISKQNKKNKLNNNKNKFSSISYNIKEKINGKTYNNFLNNNANKTFEKFNCIDKKTPKNNLENNDPVKISLNSHIPEIKKYSNKNSYIINTETSQSNNKVYEDFNKEKSIENVSNFNSMNKNSAIKKKINNSIITNKNVNSHRKTKNMNSSANNILLDDRTKTANSLINIFYINKNKKKEKNNPRKFYIRKLLREEHYYIDENGEENVFGVTQSLINSNKNHNLKITSVKDDPNTSKKTKEIYINTLNNKYSNLKNTIPLSAKKKYNITTSADKNDNKNNINIHNNTQYFIRNVSQNKGKNLIELNKNNFNANNSDAKINNKIIYQNNKTTHNKNNNNNCSSIPMSERTQNLKCNTLIKKNHLIINQRYVPMNTYTSNINNDTKIAMSNKKVKNNITINKLKKATNSYDYISNHSYHEINSTSKQKTNSVDKNENESLDIFASNKINLYKNKFLIKNQSNMHHFEINTSSDKMISNKIENKTKLLNYKTVKRIGNLNFNNFNNLGIENSGNNIYSNYEVYEKRICNISPEANKKYYYNTDFGNKGIGSNTYKKTRHCINQTDDNNYIQLTINDD